MNCIEIKGARVNNLKNVDLCIPRDRLVVIAGVSGSGKSSLAFDTLYAEGQRRYVESLSAYARQFLGRMNKPECDYIKGLPPAVAIEQRVTSRNPRSTVGTTTEIYDYLRLLYARIGRTYSPISGVEVRKQSTEDILQQTWQYADGTKYAILSPITPSPHKTTAQQLHSYTLSGYSRLLHNGEFIRIDDWLQQHAGEEDRAEDDLWIVVDRLSVSHEKDAMSRLTDSAETALYEGGGKCRIVFLPSMMAYDFSTQFEADDITFEEPTENMFSFNSPIGACPECQGFGKIIDIDEKLVIPNTGLSVYEGCVACWRGEKMNVWKEEFCRRAAKDHFPIFEPYYNLSQQHKDWLWHGLPSDTTHNTQYKTHGQQQSQTTEEPAQSDGKVCIDTFFQMLKENQYKIQYRVMLSRYKGKTTCTHCHGTRLRKEAEYVKINGKSISQLTQMPMKRLAEWFQTLTLSDHDKTIAKRLLTEITSRLKFINDVGLGYLTLGRPANTLSGGESQRIKLTTSLGSSLVGSLYILDEPSIGLHGRDTNRLIAVLKQLKEQGNTVVVVEHDEEIIKAADYLIDVGPEAGRNGGEIVYAGNLQDINIIKPSKSHTVDYITGKETIATPTSRRHWNRTININGARHNNLKGVNASIPLNILTVVTGVSGSGKSSLIRGILYPAMKRHLGEMFDTPGEYMTLTGDTDAIKHIEFVDQNPIGKSSRSNPATYVKAYDAIRELFAMQPLAQAMGYTAQYFSFNADGGRCEECKGAGVIVVEMQFMADITLECEHCHGKRFKKDILDVKYEGKNISDVLEMTITEAMEFFTLHNQKAIVKRLKPLQDVGLGYIKLGQSSSSLSGGESQRVKLAYFIGQEKQEPTMFVFDEPTTGLHFHDIKKLLEAFYRLIDKGHTVVVIEHNMDVIKAADHIIDMGPEGGEQGGNIIATGTPEDIAQATNSITGKYLKDKLKG